MLILLLGLVFSASAADSGLCEVLNLKDCDGVAKMARRSGAQSAPSTATATQFNPANVSHDRGLGLETMYQPGQAPVFSFVTGTGKTGAALVTSKIENAFFGNRGIELNDDYLKRMKKQAQYQGNKQTLAIGAAIFKNRKFGLDLGLMGKYNNDLKRLNPGVGISGRFYMFSFGASSYRDDVRLEFTDQVEPYSGIPYTLLTGRTRYDERYSVNSVFGGVRVQNLFADVALTQTHYSFYPADQTIKIYSFAYIYHRLLFNVALRHENSPMWKYQDKRLVDERIKNETYAGLQYSIGKYLILGLHHNYFLLRELSLSATVFF